MTTTRDSLAAPAPARRQPVALSVTVGVVVVVGWVLYRHYWAGDVYERIMQWDWPAGRLWADTLVVALVLSLPYAVALLVWGRDLVHGIAGAAAALGAGAFIWAWDRAFQAYVQDSAPPTRTSVEVYLWGSLLVLALLVPLAWGLARRSGTAWWVGLLAGPVVAAILRELELRWSWWDERVTYRGSAYHWPYEAAVYVAPFVLAVLACWALEARGRRTPEMGSSAPAAAGATSGADDPMT
jgi:hypothetical protein